MGKELMTKETILLQARFADKWEAIEACGNLLFQQGYVEKEYIHDMREREKVGTVYIGNHVAIPHGIANSEKRILEPGLSFVQIPGGVDFDGEKAYVMIGNIALICMEMDNVEMLRTTLDKEQILQLFCGR